MINLIPPETKRQLQAARSNTLLLRYNIFLLISLGFLLVASGIVYVYLGDAKASSTQAIQENNTKVSSYAPVEQQAKQFRASLSTAKQILDQEVDYTKVILKVSQLLPQGVVLDSLALDSKTFGTPTTIAAKAKNYDATLALKKSFESSPLFSNVYFASIAGTGDSSYPVKVSLNITIKKDAAK